MSFFRAIALLSQSPEKKEEIAEIVVKDAQSDRLYWMEIVLSGLIATFGLLQNSVAVIIGAMLIAPLLRPMQAMGFGIASGKPKIFWKGTHLLLKSILISIGVALIFAFFIPLKIETPEILARTAPNLLDFFIAVFSAIIAFLSLSYHRLSSSVAGVAMAAALMPPLCTVGIEIALLNFAAAWGSFLLFVVNLLAIVLVGVVMFLMYGFTPHQQEKKKRSNRNIILLLGALLLTLIPLTSSLLSISSKISVEKKAHTLLEELIPQKIPNASLTSFTVVSVDDENIVMTGQLQIPENTQIFKTTYNSLLSELENSFQKNIVLDFQMLRTANLSSVESSLVQKQKISNAVENLFPEVFEGFSLLQSSVSRTDEGWQIKNIVSVPPEFFITDEQKSMFHTQIQSQFLESVLTIDWIAVAGSPRVLLHSEKTPEDIIRTDIIQSLQEFLSHPEFELLTIEDLLVAVEDESITISAQILFPSDFDNFLVNEEKNTESSPDFLSLLAAPSVTPFSIENNNQSSFVLENFHQRFTWLIQTLPYDNIVNQIRYVPYFTPSSL